MREVFRGSHNFVTNIIAYFSQEINKKCRYPTKQVTGIIDIKDYSNGQTQQDEE